MKQYKRREDGAYLLYDSNTSYLIYREGFGYFEYLAPKKNSLSGWTVSGVVTLKQLKKELKRKEKEQERGAATLRKIIADFEKNFPEVAKQMMSV